MLVCVICARCDIPGNNDELLAVCEQWAVMVLLAVFVIQGHNSIHVK